MVYALRTTEIAGRGTSILKSMLGGEVFYPYPSPERLSVFGLCCYCRFQDTAAAPLTTAVSERSVRLLQAERAYTNDKHGPCKICRNP